MPTVAVYVPADHFRRLGSDPDRVREVALAAVAAAAFPVGGGLAAETSPGVAGVAAGSRTGQGALDGTPRPGSAASPSLPTSVREFRPDPKKKL